jgi:glutamate-1-semialdehyde 2,1-aminomutase
MQTAREDAASEALYGRALGAIPGGVNSPVRAWKGVGGVPRFIARASGSRLYDVDGYSFIDYLGGWGALVLGHAHPRVVYAIQETAKRGVSFGAPTSAEVELAELVVSAMPSVEKLRLVSSGTEAAMTAVRIARAATGRQKILKFAGCYHGHADPFLVRAGSGGMTLSVPDSLGVPRETAEMTIVADFNSFQSVEEMVRSHRGQIAAIIVEPVCGNCGVIPPEGDFLARLRRLSESDGSLLIFDEVITGFRVAWGGVQELYGVRADLTCLGKIIGGGLPLAAVGGRAGLMDQLAPEGKVYQAGTNSGNPVAVAAGLATLRELYEIRPYGLLDSLGGLLEKGLVASGEDAGMRLKVNRVGSMMWVYFSLTTVHDGDGALGVDRKTYSRFFHAMLKQGVYLPPSAYEACFLSTQHTDDDLTRTMEAAREALSSVRSGAEDV